jgi:hypothetical protein
MKSSNQLKVILKKLLKKPKTPNADKRSSWMPSTYISIYIVIGK